MSLTRNTPLTCAETSLLLQTFYELGCPADIAAAEQRTEDELRHGETA